MSLGTLLVDELLHLVERTDGYGDRRVLAGLFNMLMEDIVDVVRLDIHLQSSLVFVDHNLLGIALLNHDLEVGILGL